MTTYVEHTHPSLPGVEFRAEADAGIKLGTGERWWGSRVKWRDYGTTRKWNHVLMIDVHPFDTDLIAQALGQHITKRAA